MRVGIKYCGGCNPAIDRGLLARRVVEGIGPAGCRVQYSDFSGCEAVLVINGCSVACAETPGGRGLITVAGPSLDGEACPEEQLPNRVTEKILGLKNA